MKLGLVRIVNERLVGVKYFESKFQRELGEELNHDGVKWRVGVIGENREEIIEVHDVGSGLTPPCINTPVPPRSIVS